MVGSLSLASLAPVLFEHRLEQPNSGAEDFLRVLREMARRF